MGNVQTRFQDLFNRNSRTRNDHAASSSSNPYRYPPPQGKYFANYFLMGGERFDVQGDESYLFGANSDLNYLGTKPTTFPYQLPAKNEPTKTLRSLVNIRKPTVKLIKAEDNESGDYKANNSEGDEEQKYNIIFHFDTDVRCAITIYYFATEEISGGIISYHPRDSSMNSETFHYKRGANQVFNQPTHMIVPSLEEDQNWQLDAETSTVPIVIQCVVEEDEYIGHAHSLFCSLEKTSDGCYVIKPQKQKQMVDGLCYLLQELYGIENRANDNNDDDGADFSDECVICMSETRDTVILPCRHLCLCNSCATELRSQASNCPMCRSPFTALLHIMALRKKVEVGTEVTARAVEQATGDPEECVICLSAPQDTALNPCGHVCVCTPCSKTLRHHQSPTCPMCHAPVKGAKSMRVTQHQEENNTESDSEVPIGYETVSLIEALNGPVNNTNNASVPQLQAARNLRNSSRRKRKKNRRSKPKRPAGDEGPPPSPAVMETSLTVVVTTPTAETPQPSIEQVELGEFEREYDAEDREVAHVLGVTVENETERSGEAEVGGSGDTGNIVSNESGEAESGGSGDTGNVVPSQFPETRGAEASAGDANTAELADASERKSPVKTDQVQLDECGVGELRYSSIDC